MTFMNYNVLRKANSRAIDPINLSQWKCEFWIISTYGVVSMIGGYLYVIKKNSKIAFNNLDNLKV